jgi:putative SOS response-associated peptidase YedK
MCGRFTITAQPKIIEKRFGVKFIETDPKWHPNYNAAPSQLLPVITNEDPTHITLAQWGFIPEWDDQQRLKPQINARLESASSKRTFSDAFQSRHCLVLADGFYEWSKRGKLKQPYRFTLQDEQLFAFAGIWARQPDKDAPPTFAILTTEATADVSSIHTRMPVILQTGKERNWLPAAPGMVVIPPLPLNTIRRYPVSSSVNDVAYSDHSAIESVQEPQTLF